MGADMSDVAGWPAPAVGIEAVVFDCDGVLVDSERITNGVIAELLREQGLDIDTEGSMRLFMGKTVKELLPEIEQMTGRPLPQTWYTEFLKRRDEGLRDHVEAVPGIHKIMAYLKAHDMPYAVASGADRPKMHLTLGKCGLLDLFEPVMFGRDMVDRGKPAPDVYQLAIKTLDVNPARTIVIEDTPTGTAAGLAAGATVLGYAGTGNDDALRDAGVSQVFNDMLKLPAILTSID